MSHRLASRSPAIDVPRIRWRSIIDTSLVANPFPTLLVCLLWVVSDWPGDWARSGLWPSILHTSGTLVLFAVTFAWGRRIIRRHPRWRYLVFVVVVAMDVLGGALIVWLVVPNVASAQIVTGAVVTAIWLPLLILVVSVALTSLQEADAIVRRLSQDVAATEMELIAAQAQKAESQRALAVYLHGQVQPRMLAAALSMDSGVEGKAAAASLQDLATSLLLMPPATRPATWVGGLEHLQERWRGLVEVDVVPPMNDCAPSKVSEVLDAVDEAIANAFRHGRASRVDISWRSDGDLVEVTVIDNGTGPVDGPMGMGSALFGAVSVGGWQRDAASEGGGTVLRMRVG